MTTLAQAIDSESGTSADQKTTQKNFLSSRAKDLTKNEMESIMEGDVESMDDIALSDMHGLRDLMTFRITNNLPILPFANLQHSDPQPLLF